MEVWPRPGPSQSATGRQHHGLSVLFCGMWQWRRKLWHLPLTCLTQGKPLVHGVVFIGVITFIKSHPWQGFMRLKWDGVGGSLSCHNEMSQTGWLKQQTFIFSRFWRLKVQGQGDHRVKVRPLSLASRWPPSGCPFVAFSLCAFLVFLFW